MTDLSRGTEPEWPSKLRADSTMDHGEPFRGDSSISPSHADLTTRPLAAQTGGPGPAGRPKGGGGWRWRGLGLVIGPIAGAVAVVIVLGTGGYLFALGGEACANGISLRVAVAPEIEPVVARAARRFDQQQQKSGGQCVKTEVSSADPARTTTLLGQGAALGDTHRPDVWIPDSSLWISLLPTSGRNENAVVTPGASIAESPIVAGVPRALADTLRGQGVSAEQLSWADLLHAAGATTKGASGTAGGTSAAIPQNLVRLQVPDPTRSATGLASLVVADTLVAKGPDHRVDFTGLVWTLRAHTAADVASEFTELRPDKQGRYPVIIAPEQAVFSHNRRSPAAQVMALYPREGTLSLDYPYTIATRDGQRIQAARLLEGALRDQITREDLRTLGFRAVGDRNPEATAWMLTERASKPLAAPEPADVRRIVVEWYRLSRNIRNLSLIDVSTSMDEPAGPDLTRLQVATQAAQNVLAMLPDGTELGVWPSSTPIQGRGQLPNPPIGRLSDQSGQVTRRQELFAALGRMHTEAHGGLYDSVLATFRMMTRTYQPGPINSILVYTAGDHDKSDISLQSLLATLRQEYDPRRPVQIVMIGIGDGADRNALDQIAKVTHGSASVVRTSRQIEQIILSALSRRVCAPKC